MTNASKGSPRMVIQIQETFLCLTLLLTDRRLGLSFGLSGATVTVQLASL